MTRKFNAKAYITALNTIHYQLSQTPFTSETIQIEFKNCGLPSNPIFWSVFSKSNLVKKIGRNLYCFNEPDTPIHFIKLDTIYKEYKRRLTAYRNKWHDNKKQKDVLKRPDIQAAIKLLKDNGMDVVIHV